MTQPTKDTADKKARAEREKKIDREMQDSFPASDPPSYMGGKHIVGAPKKRETPQEPVKEAAKKAAP